MRGPALLCALLIVGLSACAQRQVFLDPKTDDLAHSLQEARRAMDELLPLPPALYATLSAGPPGESPEAARARWRKSMIFTLLNVEELERYLAELEASPRPKRKKRAELKTYRSHLKGERSRLEQLSAEAPPGPRMIDVSQRWTDLDSDPPKSELTILYQDGTSETLSIDELIPLE